MIILLEYKALKQDKVVVKVNNAYSSQQCVRCGHTHPENCKTQSEFICISCGHKTNVDLSK